MSKQARRAGNKLAKYEEPSTNLLEMPMEIMEMIIGELNFPDLPSFLRVCKTLKVPPRRDLPADLLVRIRGIKIWSTVIRVTKI
jgi:hypothetical protein